MVTKASLIKDSVSARFLQINFANNSKALAYTNPQTENFCSMLEIPNLVNPQPYENLTQPEYQGEGLTSKEQQ